MPKGERKKYSKEFKLSAVYMMLSNTMRPKEIFKMLDVDRQTVYRWVSEFKASGEKAFDEKAVLPGDEVRRLQKELADLQMENEILKKSHGILCGTTQERVSFAASELREYPARKVCQILNIPRSSYYHQRRYGAHRIAYKAEESQAVYDAFVAHHGSFGRRMLKRILEKDHIVLSENKISRILKAYDLCPKYGRKRCKNVHTSKNT